MKVPLVTNILKANDAIACQNRKTFSDKNLLAINVISSPGAGKTTLIQKTITSLKDDLIIAVIEGDIQSTYDADKISETGAQVVQINTGGGCHLDANMVSNAITQLDLSAVDLLIIENVGNLVCPAEFDLGEYFKIMLLSVPEGDDKPYKYPLMFTTVDAVVLNKTDLLPYVKFNVEAFTRAVKGINAKVKIFPISCTTGEGISTWVKWLKGQMK